MINKTILQGRLTKDIEIKVVGGFNMTEFTVAWSEKYKDTEKHLFMRCKAWRSTADFLAKYFKKGQELIVEGQLGTEEWEKDGQKQSRTLLNIEKVSFCGNKGSEQTNANAPINEDFMQIPATLEEELPFN